MRLHTTLYHTEIAAALQRTQDRGLIAPDVHFAVLEPGQSQTHAYAWEIQLGTHNQNSLPAGYRDQNDRALRVRRARGGSNSDDGGRWAATWHEWGWLIAEIFAADPGARWGANPARCARPEYAGGYASPDDFHAKTGGQFRDRGQPVTREEVSAALSHITASGPDIAAIAAEAEQSARSMAPPVPGITRNAGFTVYAVMPANSRMAGPAAAWYVAAQDERGQNVTWLAETGPDGRLCYSAGHYHSDDYAGTLADLARRAWVPGSAGEAAGAGDGRRIRFRESRALAMQELAEAGGVARPVVRDALAEAAALGIARVTLPSGSHRYIRFDQVLATFTITGN